MTYQRKSWGDLYFVRGTITRWDRQYKVLRLCVTRPGLFAATLFKECCQKAGITVRGVVRRGQPPPRSRILQTIKTQTLKDIVCTLNQESNNVVSELINKNLGAVFDSPPGTREKGLHIIRTYLQDKLNLTKKNWAIRDASGLSIENRLSASQLVLILNHLNTVMGKDFTQTLAIQGSHPHALNPATPSGIRMVVKSGTLPVTGVNSVAGYIFADGMDMNLAFAVLARRRGAGPPAYSGTFTHPIVSGIIRSVSQILQDF
jgi:PBP4 family serine-type D-alanyl-D-alanine carboxypeptidase